MKPFELNRAKHETIWTKTIRIEPLEKNPNL